MTDLAFDDLYIALNECFRQFINLELELIAYC